MRSCYVKYAPPLIIILLFFFKQSFAFDKPVVIKSIGIEQGLSNNSVRCVFQDKRGFMWFGTYDGLSRYDGYNFRVFRNKLYEPNSLIHNIISAINEDQHGNLWVGTRRGLSIYNYVTGGFTPLSLLSSKGGRLEIIIDVIKDIKADSKNNIFIGGESLGLLFSKNGASVAQQIPLSSGGTRTNQYSVQAIKIGAGGKVWVFVQNIGLCLLDYPSMTLRVVNTAVQSVSCIETGVNGVWMGTQDGVYHYNTVTNMCSKAFDINSGKLTSNYVIALTLDRNHNLWIGTFGGGVNIWDPAVRKMEHLKAGDNKGSLSSGVAYSIYEDRERRIWIGTLKGGINIVDPQKNRFQVVAHEPGNPNGLKGNFISCLSEDPDGNLWIGTEDAGFTLWNRKTNNFTNFQHDEGNTNSLPINFVTSIRGDQKNNIWIATFSEGVVRFQPSTHSFRRYQCLNPASGIENKGVFTLYEDRQKILWATTMRQGKRYGALYYYNKEADRFEAFDTNLSDLFSLHEDRQGTLWGGNLSQLVRIDRKGKKHQLYSIGHAVRAICEDNAGHLWIGTEGGGLILFDRKQQKIVARYSTEEGLSNNSVLGILDDGQGNLWLSTLYGLSKFNIKDRTFKNYYQSDGLQSNQFNYNAALRLKSGELAFGGVKGFSLFQPGHIGTIHNVPKVVFTGIKVNEHPIGLHPSYVVKRNEHEIQEIRVPYDQAVFSIDFAALEYSAPDKISYAYYLEGWDRGWNYTGNLRTANYTRLSEGTYLLRVKSTNSEGEWKTKEAALRIIVLPPWYRSWWAYSIYVLMIAGAIIFYQRYRVYQTKLKYEVALAHINAEKQKAELEIERAAHERAKMEREMAQAEYQKQQAELEKERAEREKREAELAREQAERETERVLNEKEREVNEKKLSFFTNISHEFRTPLTLIINPVKDLLQNRKAAETEAAKELPIVYRNARRLLSLVDQLLLFRKADCGMDKIKPAKLDICHLAKEVYLCFVQQAKSKNISYHFECSLETLEIYADPQKLEIILYNLLSNALKFTNSGGTISLRISETGQDAKIEVADTGTGISKEVGNRLFEKFYQADRKDAPAKPGFGIGLFLVKHFIEQHNGEIFYQSELGKGTTFTVKLLKGKDHFGPEANFVETKVDLVFLQDFKETEVSDIGTIEEVSAPIAEVITKKQSILIVDDDEQIRSYLVQLLTDKYIVQQAESGEEGMELAQKYLPDLIISDVHMKGITGIELCKTIKEDPALSHIPFILLTGRSSDELKLQGVEGGADDYITKPFDNKLLTARVANLLKSRNNLQKYFYNEITLSKSNLKISPEYKEFLEKCISVVESHLEDDNFNVKVLMKEMGMSHTNLLTKVKSVSGQPINIFIRYIRLRKAAELFITTNYNINQTAFMVGIRDIKYFREQFHKLFGMNPSEYIKKYRGVFGQQYTLDKGLADPEVSSN